MNNYIALAVFGVVLIAGYASAATQCVYCTTLTNAKCNDLYSTAENSNFARNCTYGCKKTKVDTSGVVVVTRECASSSMTAKCEETNINFIVKINTKTCHCDGDFCNGAHKMALPVSALLVTLFATVKAMF